MKRLNTALEPNDTSQNLFLQFFRERLRCYKSDTFVKIGAKSRDLIFSSISLRYYGSVPEGSSRVLSLQYPIEFDKDDFVGIALRILIGQEHIISVVQRMEFLFNRTISLTPVLAC